MVLRLRRVLLGARVKKLDDDGLIALGDEAAHLRRRVLVAHELRQLQEPREVLTIPGGRVLALGVHALDLFLRVVDERAELRLLFIRHAVSKDVFDLLANDARAVVQDVEERLVLAVQIAHEMLNALGQTELRLQGDELFVDGFQRRVLLGEKPQELVLLLRALFHRDPLQCDLFSYAYRLPRKQGAFLLACGGAKINFSYKYKFIKSIVRFHKRKGRGQARGRTRRMSRRGRGARRPSSSDEGTAPCRKAHPRRYERVRRGG